MFPIGMLFAFLMVASVMGFVNAFVVSAVFIGGLFGSIHLISRVFKIDLITVCFASIFILLLVFILNMFRF